MQKLIQLLLAPLFCVSCNSHDDPVAPPADENPGPGTWAVTPKGVSDGDMITATIGPLVDVSNLLISVFRSSFLRMRSLPIRRFQCSG